MYDLRRIFTCKKHTYKKLIIFSIYKLIFKYLNYSLNVLNDNMFKIYFDLIIFKKYFLEKK